MARRKIPRWIKRAAEVPMVTLGMGSRRSADHLVLVPRGTMISDGQGGQRPSLLGEKRPLGEFVSVATLGRWVRSERVVKLRAELDEDHRSRLQVQARKTLEATGDVMPLLAQGLRPRVDELGRVEKTANGEIRYERLNAATQIQAIQTALRVAEYANGVQTQRVEVEHSGKIASGPELSDEELQRKIAENLAAMGVTNGAG